MKNFSHNKGWNLRITQARVEPLPIRLTKVTYDGNSYKYSMHRGMKKLCSLKLRYYAALLVDFNEYLAYFPRDTLSVNWRNLIEQNFGIQYA